MDKRFMLTLAAILVILGGIFWFTQKKDASAPSNSAATQTNGSNHVAGKNVKGVTVVEYGDFQCPACSQYFPIVQQLKEKYANDISFQFRHFPLVQIHPHAMEAARAAEAAGLQGKFWEMHDLLYQQQQSWANASDATKIFENYATQLSLNIEKYKQDFASKAVLDVINADVRKAQSAGATGTPSFEIDGKKIDETPRDFEAFAKLIDAAIATKAKQ